MCNTARVHRLRRWPTRATVVSNATRTISSSQACMIMMMMIVMIMRSQPRGCHVDRAPGVIVAVWGFPGGPHPRRTSIPGVPQTHGIAESWVKQMIVGHVGEGVAVEVCVARQEDVEGSGYWLRFRPMTYGVVWWPFIVGAVGCQRWATVLRRKEGEPGIVHTDSWGDRKFQVWSREICSPLQYSVYRGGCDTRRATVCLLLDREPVDCCNGMAIEGFRTLTTDVLKDALAVIQ